MIVLEQIDFTSFNMISSRAIAFVMSAFQRAGNMEVTHATK